MRVTTETGGQDTVRPLVVLALLGMEEDTPLRPVVLLDSPPRVEMSQVRYGIPQPGEPGGQKLPRPVAQEGQRREESD